MSPASRDRRARRGRRRFYGRRARATISRKARLACDRSMLHALVAVAVGAASAGAALKSALALVGFTQAGVAGGSLAATAQSAFYGGLVPAGGAFALLQSWGATMSAVSALKSAAMAVAASACWCVGKSSGT